MSVAVRFGAAAVVVASLGALASCGSASAPQASPKAVTPTDLGGSAGVAPRTVDARNATITTPDRLVAIDDVTARDGSEPGTTDVVITFTITATTDAAVENRASDFQLIGRTGDVFAPGDATDDPFFSVIEAHTTRSGPIEFRMPQAASVDLHLLYRPEDPADAVVVPVGGR